MPAFWQQHVSGSLAQLNIKYLNFIKEDFGPQSGRSTTESGRYSDAAPAGDTKAHGSRRSLSDLMNPDIEM